MSPGAARCARPASAASSLIVVMPSDPRYGTASVWQLRGAACLALVGEEAGEVRSLHPEPTVLAPARAPRVLEDVGVQRIDLLEHDVAVAAGDGAAGLDEPVRV